MSSIKDESSDGMRHKWFVDSCTGSHMTNQRDILSNLVTYNTDGVQIASQDSEIKTVGYGSVRLEQNINGKKMILGLGSVAYMLALRTNLMTLPLTQSAGISFEFPGSVLMLTHTGEMGPITPTALI